MAMRRKAKPAKETSREYVMGKAGLVAGHADLFAGMAAIESRIDDLQSGLRAEMRAGFSRVGVEMDKRPTSSELDVRFNSIDERFDRVLTALDRVTGKLHDNAQSHTVFGAMLGEHRRTLVSHDQRLTSLESRVPPRTP